MACEHRGGRFVEGGRLVYACVFENPRGSQRRDHGERACERSAGRFVDVSALVYTCVLPGGTLPDPFPVVP